MIVDIYSRKIVHSKVYNQDCSKYAVEFLTEVLRINNISPGTLVLHSDNGPSMKALETLQLLTKMGITLSHSRPRTSNDNPYSESIFKTMKYCGFYSKRGFDTLEKANKWLAKCKRISNQRLLISWLKS